MRRCYPEMRPGGSWYEEYAALYGLAESSALDAIRTAEAFHAFRAWLAPPGVSRGHWIEFLPWDEFTAARPLMNAMIQADEAYWRAMVGSWLEDHSGASLSPA